MRKSICLVSLMSMTLLCACKESSTVNTYQPPINVITSVTNEESAVKNTKTQKSTKTTQKTNNNKANQTATATVPTTTTPKATNSAIKSLLIDGNGNLVSTNANGTFSVIGQVQGTKGDKGDKGEQGSQGEKGEAGRGIESCNVDSDGNLIITYTDGSTQNAGNVRQEVIVHDYEQLGYKLVNPYSDIQTGSISDIGVSYDYTISNFKIELININDNNPSKKYTYKVQYDYEITNYVNTYVGMPYFRGFVYIYVDNISDVCRFDFDSNKSGTYTYTFTSDIPYVTITLFKICVSA